MSGTMPPKKLSLIIPYRDRQDQLRAYSDHILKYFTHDKIDRDIPIAVTVVEQEEGLPFNIGAIRNVGFDLTREFDYHCFHDVDFLPIWTDHRYPAGPTRLLWFGAEVRPLEPGSKIGAFHKRDTYFSGVVMFNREDFECVNGYSNEYWGWGSEDDDMRTRCQLEHLKIQHRDGYYQSLQHKSEGYTSDGALNEIGLQNNVKREEKFHAMKNDGTYKTEGLSSLRYEVLDMFERTKIDADKRPPNLISWKHVKVRLFQGEGGQSKEAEPHRS